MNQDPPDVPPLDTANLNGITAHQGKVVCLRLSTSMTSDEALALAAWLIVAAELNDHRNPLATVMATVDAIRNT